MEKRHIYHGDDEGIYSLNDFINFIKSLNGEHIHSASFYNRLEIFHLDGLTIKYEGIRREGKHGLPANYFTRVDVFGDSDEIEKFEKNVKIEETACVES